MSADSLTTAKLDVTKCTSIHIVYPADLKLPLSSSEIKLKRSLFSSKFSFTKTKSSVNVRYFLVNINATGHWASGG